MDTKGKNALIAGASVTGYLMFLAVGTMIIPHVFGWLWIFTIALIIASLIGAGVFAAVRFTLNELEEEAARKAAQAKRDANYR